MRTENRHSQAGITLVETLVVLALIGTVAGVVALGTDRAGRTSVVREEAELLAARMRRASEEVILDGHPIALLWSDRAYRFERFGADGWAPHPVAILGEVRTLEGGARIAGGPMDGYQFVVTGTALPVDGAHLALTLVPSGKVGQDGALRLVWDGVVVTLLEVTH